MYEKVRDYSSSTNDLISDNIEDSRVVKTFALEKSEVKKMRHVNTKWIK